jgi:peptidoglycan/xylan/chitin deacetylase (PgdA/CDA1 family)
VGPLRAVVKRGIGALALLPPLSSWTRRGLREGINVAYTHYVGETVPYYADFYVGSTVERFDRDLTILKRHFEFVRLADVVRQDPARGEPSRPLLALTFDDGFDALRNGVMEVLDHHAIRMTSFVLTGTVGNVNLMWRNKLTAIRALRAEPLYVRHYNSLMAKVGLPGISRGDELLSASAGWEMGLKEELVDALWKACDMPALDEFLDEHRPYFTWDGLRRWLAAGHDVGLHTATHPFCSKLGPEEIRAEIEEPAALLRARLGLRFLPFSYPFGIRLGEAAERQLYEEKIFDCAFGIEGFVPRGTPDYRLERASIEGDLTFSVFGSVLLGATRRSSKIGSAHRFA